MSLYLKIMQKTTICCGYYLHDTQYVVFMSSSKRGDIMIEITNNTIILTLKSNKLRGR